MKMVQMDRNTWFWVEKWLRGKDHLLLFQSFYDFSSTHMGWFKLLATPVLDNLAPSDFFEYTYTHVMHSHTQKLK